MAKERTDDILRIESQDAADMTVAFYEKLAKANLRSVPPPDIREYVSAKPFNIKDYSGTHEETPN